MRRIICGTLTAGLALLAACNTPVNTAERATPTAMRQLVADKRVINDSRSVEIVGINEANSAGGVLRVQVDLQNPTSGPRTFSYKFEWFDASGILIEGPASMWLSRAIEGDEVISIVGTAPTPTAKDFRFKVMKSHAD